MSYHIDVDVTKMNIVVPAVGGVVKKVKVVIVEE